MSCNGGNAASAEGPVNKAKSHQSQLQQLPAAELAAYLIGFTASLGMAGYAFCTQVGYQSLTDLDPTSTRDGFLGYRMDNTFTDFNYFLSFFTSLLAVLASHLLVSQLTLRFCSMKLHHLVCAAFTLALSCSLLSVKCSAMLLALHCCALLAGCTGSTLLVWSVILVAFLRFTGASFGGGQAVRTALNLDTRGAHLFYPICGYFYCRLLSMGLSLAARTRRGAGFAATVLAALPESLHYTFYLPNFVGGPVVTMDDFLAMRRQQPQQQQQQRPDRIAQSFFRMCRLVLWLCVALAMTHWFPAGAYLETVGVRLVRHAGPISFGHVAFAMYIRGQLFMLEYVQYYGWPAVFASLDGVRLPHWPACICRVTSYREMWRLFDRGLFAIVREHVYIPLGGSRMGLARQLVATAASFGFICVYHGNYDSVQQWILLNLVLVSAELLAVRVYRGWMEAELLKWMSSRCLRRLTGVVAAANLIPPSLGIFYFLYGIFTGNLVMHEVIWKPLSGQASMASFAIFFANFYFSVQLAIEYKLRRGGNADKD